MCGPMAVSARTSAVAWAPPRRRPGGRPARRYRGCLAAAACAPRSASRVSSTVSNTVVDSEQNLPLLDRLSTTPAVAVLSGASARA